MGHIFISYSHKDSKYVGQLEKKLIEEGFNVWIDHRIDYGSQWPKEIEKAVDTCDAYIVVMSEDASSSMWVQREVIHAEKKNKPFFPLLLKGEVWFSLGNIQYVDVTGGVLPPDEFYRKLEKVTPRKRDKTTFQPSESIKRRAQTKLERSKISISFRIVVRIIGVAFIFIAAIFGIPKLANFLTPSQPTAQTQEMDKDNDGVLDLYDSCPTRGDLGYGVDSNGCPILPTETAEQIQSPTKTQISDSDGDGVSDLKDLCPNQGNQGYGVDAQGCPISSPEPNIPNCPGALPTRIKVGITIEVTTNQVNPVSKLGIRPQPTLDTHKMFELLSGERMTVLDGPECANDSYFWYITSSRGDGWVREGNTEFYFVDPLQ